MEKIILSGKNVNVIQSQSSLVKEIITRKVMNVKATSKNNGQKYFFRNKVKDVR